MARQSRRLHDPVVSTCVGLLLVVFASSTATARQEASTSSVQAPPSRDFMLGRPHVAIGIRGNWLFARADSDIFDFVTTQLTIDKSSFNLPAAGGELAFYVSPRLDGVVGFDVSKSSTPSEYRDLVDNELLPIQQTTSLRQFQFFGSAKFALLPKGRRISRFAWIPSTVTPYVGAGGGALNYSFEQYGDFVDFQDNDVFTSSFKSSGWTPVAHVFGGVDLRVHGNMYMSLEGRYQWASGDLSQEFLGFAPIDLAGFRLGAGFHVAF